MASTDSTIPDSSTGDSMGSHAGQDVTDKIKSAVKGNIGGSSDGEKAENDPVKNTTGGGILGKTEGSAQNTLS